MSFYRKYRPQVFDEIDNSAVRERLLSLLSKDKTELPHAFLFTGPKGAGKTTAARLIAKLFNCTKPLKNGAPCGKCNACTAIADGRYLDVLELDAASNRGIDEIRTLREGIGLVPTSGTYKIYIIDEVHMLTTEAFNALLKTLEEPPPHAAFVLATTDPQKIPATIKSRCVHINFGRAQTEELLHGLARVVKEEKIDIADDALAFVASFADGAFRDAMKLLEQVSFEKGKLTKEKVQKLLAASEEKTIIAFFDALAAKDAKTGLDIVAQLVATGRDIRSFITECLVESEHRLVAAVTGKEKSQMTIDDLKDFIGKLTQAYGDLRISPIPQLPLELAVVEFCKISAISNKPPAAPSPTLTGLLTMEKLTEHWKDFIEAMKPYNNSIAGVLRSSRPKGVDGGIVTIEAFYSFHQEKLSEMKTRELIAQVLKKLFGEKVKVEVVLGKK
jgi:DNA polymerase-3 subunit gamma/tau